jgi:heptosyltransferase-2
MAEPKPDKILVIQTAFLGDVVLTTPLLAALKERFPSAHLSVLVVPRTEPILSGHPAVDQVLTYDKKGEQRGWLGLIRTAKRLAMNGFDLCLLPHRSIRSALLARLAGIPRRIGFRGSPGSLLYTDRVTRDPSLHEVDRNLSLLLPLGVEPASLTRRLQVGVDTSARDIVERILKDHGIESGDILIGMAPGSVWATKRWLPEGFSAVADALMDSSDFGGRVRIVLLGSKEEEWIADRIEALCRQKPVNVLGQSLPELAATLSRCRLLITNDNGAMHVAAALGVPIVAIFGSTSPRAGYGPYTRSAEIVEHDLPCRPCGLHGYPRCPLGHFKCMKEIIPEEVTAAVEKQLKGSQFMVHGSQKNERKSDHEL